MTPNEIQDLINQTIQDQVPQITEPIALRHAEEQRRLHEQEFESRGALLLVSSVPFVVLVGLWIIHALNQANHP
ncbi:hypothetical protein OsccyDRAFT_0552 [Leptolyngbyaceae cyanobacterium JSC-12]|nr:hypothetical protein OsccyDRAFT_0552 [Leptolyngbyaceae cyanobacterium JSC-12]